MVPSASIRVLSETVINQIAAGEVVERPASVLKELLENALDAGATRIDVEVALGGRKLIAVTDDGAGMNRDDALLAIERHATSKIRDVGDIERIATLGFRGEALAAIASVSRLRMQTCARGAVGGVELRVHGGKLQDVRDVGAPAGTRVDVRDLFFNVPARRKFLRSRQTELNHIRQTFIGMALAQPRVALSLRVDGRELYRLPAGSSDEGLRDRLRDLFGEDVARHLRALPPAEGGIRVGGLAGLPSYHRADRAEQYIFVNGRVTGAPLIGFAVREGYRGLLPRDRHPAVFLAIAVDPSAVDVNVHPTKREVRFRFPSDVRDAVVGALRRTLERSAAGTDATAGDMPPAVPRSRATLPEAHLAIPDLPPTRAFAYPGLPMLPDRSGPAPTPRGVPEPHRPSVAKPFAAGTGAAMPPPAAPVEAAPDAPWSWCRVLGQVGELYVVLEIEDGLVLMDPHAAHERVLYDRLMAAYEAGRPASQTLLAAETVALPPADAARVRAHLDALREMGFGVAPFGGDSFLVDALPAEVRQAPPRELLVRIAAEMERFGTRSAKTGLREAAIAQAACKAAVKARDALTLEEIERLVVDLARTRMPYTCPHGRPTLIYQSFQDLNRKFGRTASGGTVSEAAADVDR